MTRSAGLRGETPRLGRRFVDRLEVDLDLHFLANEHAVRDRHVPGETEVASVDGDRRGRTKVLPALSVLDDTDQLDVEAHGPRNLADGEVAAGRVVGAALREDRVALERDLRVLLRVEEVGRLKVSVALRVAGGDSLDRCRDLEVTLLGLRGIELDAAAHLAEASANGAQHHVLDRKVHRGVGWVDIPEHMFPLAGPKDRS